MMDKDYLKSALNSFVGYFNEFIEADDNVFIKENEAQKKKYDRLEKNYFKERFLVQELSKIWGVAGVLIKAIQENKFNKETGMKDLQKVLSLNPYAKSRYKFSIIDMFSYNQLQILCGVDGVMIEYIEKEDDDFFKEYN